MIRTTSAMLHLQVIAVLLTAGWAHIQAAALPRAAFNSSSLVLLHTRILDNGRLEYWGAPTAEGEATSDFGWDVGWGNPEPYDPAAFVSAPAQRRCGSNQVHCSNANLGSTQACQVLIDALRSNPWGIIPLPSYGMFTITDHGRCGLNWGGQIPGLLNGYLIPAATHTLAGCSNCSPSVSGYATDVNLNGHCTVQCLSKSVGCFN